MTFFVTIPVQICFAESLTTIKSNFFSDILKYFCIITFSLDIAINFNLGFYDNGLIVLNRKLIIKRYFKKHFITDILALVSIYFYFVHSWHDLN